MEIEINTLSSLNLDQNKMRDINWYIQTLIYYKMDIKITRLWSWDQDPEIKILRKR